MPGSPSMRPTRASRNRRRSAWAPAYTTFKTDERRDGAPDVQLGGIQGSGTGTAYGPITGFGSIFVNGVEFTTSSAQINIDDQPGSESDLQVGEVVTVTGTINADGKTGTATQVTFDGDVTGRVVQIDSAGGTFIVLGQ